MEIRQAPESGYELVHQGHVVAWYETKAQARRGRVFWRQVGGAKDITDEELLLLHQTYVGNKHYEKRAKQVNVALNPEEHAALEASAARAGLEPGPWVRTLIRVASGLDGLLDQLSRIRGREVLR